MQKLKIFLSAVIVVGVIFIVVVGLMTIHQNALNKILDQKVVEAQAKADLIIPNTHYNPASSTTTQMTIDGEATTTTQ